MDLEILFDILSQSVFQLRSLFKIRPRKLKFMTRSMMTFCNLISGEVIHFPFFKYEEFDFRNVK